MYNVRQITLLKLHVWRNDVIKYVHVEIKKVQHRIEQNKYIKYTSWPLTIVWWNQCRSCRLPSQRPFLETFILKHPLVWPFKNVQLGLMCDVVFSGFRGKYCQQLHLSTIRFCYLKYYGKKLKIFSLDIISAWFRAKKAEWG